VLTFEPFLLGTAYGATAAASPGPLMAFAVATSFKSGPRPGYVVAVTPAVVELPLAPLIVTLGSRIPQQLLYAIALVGGGYMVVLVSTPYGRAGPIGFGKTHPQICGPSFCVRCCSTSRVPIR